MEHVGVFGRGGRDCKDFIEKDFIAKVTHNKHLDFCTPGQSTSMNMELLHKIDECNEVVHDKWHPMPMEPMDCSVLLLEQDTDGPEVRMKGKNQNDQWLFRQYCSWASGDGG